MQLVQLDSASLRLACLLCQYPNGKRAGLQLKERPGFLADAGSILSEGDWENIDIFSEGSISSSCNPRCSPSASPYQKYRSNYVIMQTLPHRFRAAYNASNTNQFLSIAVWAFFTHARFVLLQDAVQLDANNVFEAYGMSFRAG